MILGIGLIVLGYSVLYWGLHHFCGVDCPQDQHQKGCHCRYSLVTLLGLDVFHVGHGPKQGVQFG